MIEPITAVPVPLRKCPDCQTLISKKALACVRCGRPLRLPHNPLMAFSMVGAALALSGELTAAATILGIAGGVGCVVAFVSFADSK